MHKPRIAIIGAGPGGLTLAKLLSIHSISPVVFELDAGPDARPQGGSLDLHADGGLRALEVAGLREAFEKVARHDDQGIRIYDKAGRLRYEEADSAAGGRPEVDRAELRQLLIDAVPAGTIAWNRRVTRVEPRPDGTVAVHAEGHAPQIFELVVGADGAWSRVRRPLSDVEPLYTGVSFVELEIDDLDARHPDLAAAVGHGKIMALGDEKLLIAQRNARSNLRVYFGRRAPVTWARELAPLPPAAIKAEVIASLAGWGPTLHAFIERSRDRALALPLYALPVGHRWGHRAGLTLLGDAAHLMSPFAGEGVNSAMRDALELALVLSSGPDLDAAVAQYEAAMFARVRDAAIESAVGLEVAVSATALDRMIDIMRSHAPPT
jgi:2-polyprenyl-6-methoxyphenol hydroxylase-like FAD-dependent oxidoreductase